jgi:hypothetical protein
MNVSVSFEAPSKGERAWTALIAVSRRVVRLMVIAIVALEEVRYINILGKGWGLVKRHCRMRSSIYV